MGKYDELYAASIFNGITKGVMKGVEMGEARKAAGRKEAREERKLEIKEEKLTFDRQKHAMAVDQWQLENPNTPEEYARSYQHKLNNSDWQDTNRMTEDGREIIESKSQAGTYAVAGEMQEPFTATDERYIKSKEFRVEYE